MMQLLITEHEKRSGVLDGDIETLCLRLQAFKTHKTFVDREPTLKKHLEDFNKDILTKKEGKYGRDHCAFEDNRAYRLNQQQPKNNNKFKNRKDHYSAISNSSSSLSSVSSQVFTKKKKSTSSQLR